MLETLRLSLAVLTLAGSRGSSHRGPCDSSAAYHLLDFWIGEWDVYAGGKLDGHDRVVRQLDGCAVTEEWTDANGSRGFSLFYYQPAADSWRQVWVTDHATMPGGLKEKALIARGDDGGVRFQGTIIGPGGVQLLDRTTLTPLPSGEVHQVIELSRDQGLTWRAIYDARYHRSEGANGAPPGPMPGARLESLLGHHVDVVDTAGSAQH